MSDVAEKIVEQFNVAKGKRTNFENAWNDISEYYLPHRGRTTSKLADGATVDPKVSRGIGQQLIEKLASTIISGAVNTKTKWIKLTSTNPELQDNSDFLKWADKANDVLLQTFLNPSSNFDSQNYQFILDLIAYGTAALNVVAGPKGTPVLFRARHISEIFLSEDYTGKVDKVYCKTEYTARQLVQHFGIENVSDDAKEDLVENPEEKHTVIHVVMPSDDAKRTLGVEHSKKFVGIYVEEGAKSILSIEGFNQNPYIAARWVQYTNEIYGRSPAWIGLPILRQLNFLNVMKSKALTLAISPPILLSDDAVFPQIRMEPFGLIPGGLDNMGNQMMQFLTSPSQLDKAFFEEDKLKQELEGIFYINSLPDQNQVAMTATEVNTRTMKELKAMGPQVTKLINEYLEPVIRRVFNILMEKKYIEPLPKEFGNVNIDINYTGYLANIQKTADVEALNSMLSSVVPLAQIDPNVLAVFNFEAIARHTANISGLPPTLMFSQEEVAAKQQAAAEQQQAMAQTQQLQGTADAISKLRRS